MEYLDRETLYFRRCRNLDGGVLAVDLARRNGRVALRFDHACFNPPARLIRLASPDLAELIREITANLTACERRTWLKLLDGRSILDIAAEERVSRSAVYARIRGKSPNNTGGMIAKNDYVAIWWRRRQSDELAHTGATALVCHNHGTGSTGIKSSKTL